MLAVLAFAVLLTLKLTHVVAWSWWIITSPLLVVGAIYVVLGLIGFGLLHALGKELKK